MFFELFVSVEMTSIEMEFRFVLEFPLDSCGNSTCFDCWSDYSMNKWNRFLKIENEEN